MCRVILLLLIFYTQLSHASIVVLIHGLGRNSSSMHYIQENLSQESAKIYLIDYKSQSQGFHESLQECRIQIEAIISQNSPDEKIYYIGHSLGGLIAFRLFFELEAHRQGHCITLGSPYLGSEAAFWLSNWSVMRFIQGPVLYELSSPMLSSREQSQFYDNLFCIAGNKPSFFNLLFFLKKPHDGLVSVHSAIPNPLWEHMIVGRSHNGLLYDHNIVREINNRIII